MPTQEVLLKRLDELMTRGKSLLSVHPELTVETMATAASWETSCQNLVRMMFGGDSDYYKNVCKVLGWNNSRAQLNALVAILENAQKDFLAGIYGAGQNEQENSSLRLVEEICSRFHLVARQLRNRHDNRSTLEISDEYDVQDLLHSLLKIHFDDIRPEEWTPSYAGASSRMDFLLKNERIVIETKMMRKGLGSKELGDQLLVDIERYKEHPDCATLFCLVYDPEWVIPNPEGLENDLSKTDSGL